MAESRFKWQGRWVLLGALLSFGLTLVANFLATALGSAPVAIVLEAAAFVGAGAITRVISPAVLPRDPAIGAAMATAILAAVQLAMLRRRHADLPMSTLVVSLAITVAAAYGLTWLGAWLVQTVRKPRAA